MPGVLIRFLAAAALCVGVAGCGTSAVETAEMPDKPISGYRAVVVSVPLERGVNREIARIVEAEAVKAIKQSRRWRLVVAGSLAAGQKEGLNVAIDLRQQETGGFKEFTNTSTATVSLSDISTGQRLGGVSISASGASMEFTARAIGEQTAAWLVKLP